MPLETGEFITDLVPSNPPGTDPKSQGDDHLRLVKKVLQQSFPNMDAAFTGDAQDLNNLLLLLVPTTPAEKLVQRLGFKNSDVVGGVATLIPGDNTTPQITEGSEYVPFSQEITPITIGDIIRVRIKMQIATDTNNIIALALFIAGNNDAVQVDVIGGRGPTALPVAIIMTHEFPVLNLDPIQLMCRFGSNVLNGDLWINANGDGNTSYLGNLFSEMTVTEIEPLP